MSDGVARTGSNSAHPQADAQTNTATKEAGRPSCGVAGMESTKPVVRLPEFPLVEAPLSSATAPASCRAEDTAQARLAIPSQNANAKTADWAERLNSRLSRCYSADDFVAILKELRDPEQQRFVVDRALIRFMNLGEIGELAKQVRDDRSLRTTVAQQLLKTRLIPRLCKPHPTTRALRSLPRIVRPASSPRFLKMSSASFFRPYQRMMVFALRSR
jgi:hypothetical protein